ATEQSMIATLLSGYVVGGVFWFVAALLASTVVVTNFGLVGNVNRSDSIVAWSQVVDYFQFEHGHRGGYVLFYRDDSGTRHRMELALPLRHRACFQQLIHAKLDARFEFTMQQVYGKKAFEDGP